MQVISRIRKIEDQPLEDTCGVVTSWIKATRRTNTMQTLSFVDVAVNTDDRLVPLYSRAHGGAAGRGLGDHAVLNHRTITWIKGVHCVET